MYPRSYCSYQAFWTEDNNNVQLNILMVNSDGHLLPSILVAIVISAEVYYTEVFVAMTTHYVQNSTHRSLDVSAGCLAGEMILVSKISQGTIEQHLD